MTPAPTKKIMWFRCICPRCGNGDACKDEKGDVHCEKCRLMSNFVLKNGEGLRLYITDGNLMSILNTVLLATLTAKSFGLV